MLEGRCQRKRRMIGLLSEAREAPGWRLSFPISDTCRYMVALTPPPARGRATPLGSCWPTFKFALSRNKFLNQIVFLPFATKLLRLCFHRRESVHGGGVPGPGGVHSPRWVPGPGWCPFLGGAWSPGGSCSRGGLLPGVWCFFPACTEAEPPSPGRDGYCCGRYAFHWNAFLYLLLFMAS